MIIWNLQALTKNVKSTQLKELHVSAKPLIETCNPDTKQKINESVQTAESDWKNTNNIMQNLRDKYERALNLWQKYRDRSDAIKNWATDRMCTINILKPLDTNTIEVICRFHFKYVQLSKFQHRFK